jgi:tetratricopeptide (TPR) repeat protein
MSSQSRITPDRAVLIGLLLTAAIYCRDLKYDFILDDMPLILVNQPIPSWHNLKMAFITDIFFIHGSSVPIVLPAMHYRPVFTLWLTMNQLLFGSVFPWWHLTSLLLHICVIFLVYKLGVKVLTERWTAALAALLFAFHPIHVESVSYVSASTDLLVTLFLLIAFLSYSRFREQDASPGYLVAALFTAALAMLSKETAAMFPWILVAYEALRKIPPGRSRWWMRFVWTLPFFAVVAIYAVVRTLLFGRNLGPGPGGSRLAAIADTPLVLIVYLRNLLWSFRLSFFYPVEWASKWTLLKGAGVVFTLVIATFLWNHYRDRPGIRLQLLWTAILFVPPVIAVTTFLKEDWVHDRHMYLVSVPFCLIVAALLTDPKLPRRASVIVSSFILAVLLVATAVQIPRFSDGLSIFESALKVAPRNALAHRYFAAALYSCGHYEDAFREFRITAQLRPKDPAAYREYAEALVGVGRDEEAATEYAKALNYSASPTPYRAFLLYRLGTIDLKYSKSVAGEAYLREALQIAPETLNYHAALAEALRQQGRTQEADEEMRLEASVQKSFIHATPLPGQQKRRRYL